MIFSWILKFISYIQRVCLAQKVVNMTEKHCFLPIMLVPSASILHKNIYNGCGNKIKISKVRYIKDSLHKKSIVILALKKQKTTKKN